MRGFVLGLWLAACVDLLASSAFAQNGVYLPPPPQGPGGEDTVETASGAKCRQSVNSNKGYVDLGVTASSGGGLPQGGSNVFISVNQRDRDATAYARLVIPIGKQPDRVDCSRLYELEIQRLRQEVELLKMNPQ